MIDQLDLPTWKQICHRRQCIAIPQSLRLVVRHQYEITRYQRRTFLNAVFLCLLRGDTSKTLDQGVFHPEDGVGCEIGIRMDI